MGGAHEVGRIPVYAGFDLDQASLRTGRVDRHRDRLRGTCIGLWHFHVPGDKNSAARSTQRSKRRKSFALLLFWNVSRPKREGLVYPQFKLLSVGSNWLDPNIVTYANEGGGNERYHLMFGQFRAPN
jgi:hypothetical protein